MDTKKILIKDFLKNSLKYVYRVNKFKKYYNCSLNDFLLIEFNNRPYQELQEDCRRFLKQNISESKEVAVENALENISAEYDSNTYSTTPIGVIPYSERLLELIFSKFSKIKIIFENLSSLKLLIEILDIRYQDIKLINGLGVSKIQELQNFYDFYYILFRFSVFEFFPA